MTTAANTDILDLARPELRSLTPYAPGRHEPGCVRLNANESPYRAPGDATVRGLNRYPPPRPDALRDRLAQHYRVAPDELLVTRGSSEAIDVLIRAFCAARRDAVLVCPPTFDMYRLYAAIQGVELVEVPLLRAADPARDFRLDAAGVVARLNDRTKLVFICSPNNPTGRSMEIAHVEAVCRAARGRALVVLDEAYMEFSADPGFERLRRRYDVARLRTLSKFVSLAGVRCGALIATPRLIGFLGNVLPPYTFPTPSIELVLAALAGASLELSGERVALLRRERARLAAALAAMPGVIRVWPSDGNFILIEPRDADAFAESARREGILVRTFARHTGLRNCVRITVGRPEQNDRLLAAIADSDPAAGRQENDDAQDPVSR